MDPLDICWNREKGLYGGASFSLIFRQAWQGHNSLISSTVTVATVGLLPIYAQNSTFNVGLRKRIRLLFSFRLTDLLLERCPS